MRLILGDCNKVLDDLINENIQVDSIVTDPPYGIRFMGKGWDYQVPSVEVWEKVLQILKPGGHALVACGTRTQHRMAVNLEDAGFEIRDLIAWVYGSGFPKSTDISKQIDKMAGVERDVIGRKLTAYDNSVRRISLLKNSNKNVNIKNGKYNGFGCLLTEPATDAAKQWDGWGTALKPAMELWTLCRKPLSEKTIAENVLKYGTGGLNIDKCRIETQKRTPGYKNPGNRMNGISEWNKSSLGLQREVNLTQGRFPANLIHDGSDDVLNGFPETQSGSFNGTIRTKSEFFPGLKDDIYYYKGDSGSASRFFYCAKASASERNMGLNGIERKKAGSYNIRTDNHSEKNGMTTEPRANNHPTVKPLALMRYLCRLITPPGGIVLDPYTGSGTTGIAALKEGFDFIGIELEKQYFEIAEKRINENTKQLKIL